MDQSFPLRVLVLDDDVAMCDLLRFNIESRFPSALVECRNKPDPTGDFDVYLLDNDFEGKREIGRLIQLIRSRRPQALVVAFSAVLDAPTLKTLLNQGCDAACDKTVPTDLVTAMNVIERFRQTQSQRGKPGFVQTINSLADLLRQWNRRMTLNQEVAAHSVLGR
ncbi:MAG: response regulator [Phycisphaerae bacterium]